MGATVRLRSKQATVGKLCKPRSIWWVCEVYRVICTKLLYMILSFYFRKSDGEDNRKSFIGEGVSQNQNTGTNPKLEVSVPVPVIILNQCKIC